MTNTDEVATIIDMTDLHRQMPDSGAGTDAALEAADNAARAAGVTVRALGELADFTMVYEHFDSIWHPDPTNPPVTAELMRALTKAGNYVSGAFDGDQLVGACVGFFGPPAYTTLHSHIAGVGWPALGRGVGVALKLHQRAWAMQHGVSMIEWTFDPLVRRNAYFNMVKLGALPVEYLTNFYGSMRDQINGIDDTDRLLVHWDLMAPSVVAACAGRFRPADVAALRARGAVVGLDRSAAGEPLAGTVDGSIVLVAVPADIESMRVAEPELARWWRVALRETLEPLMADGARVTGFDKSGWYVVTREDAR